ncbi:ABC transporter substrate-binding protein [Streptomyces sp. WI04-05B]|uniref:ABC transporter substrate-binding protein n=1 Tax=Streptomyces TaxID=1883 RepID=UPI0029B5CE41|nr:MULTISPECIES: sugar ABC transporter substrate-binding protein [unclassified Streptomyces]MDX2541127.1 sugar ABC transporter substrate-binding protein [Streptomyces sp. WI04-05B]MDX2585643.1 sugar ABC transporter substrate-binding protein [Streptomyces sp. WI04-05A]MDX3752153.1 sugar ABC transporter substrate-binding protein [Streptomyces sp. AK08-02]
MRTPSRRRPRATLALAAAGTLLTPLLSGCWAGAGGSGSGGDAVNVLMVNNPQMVELQKLTAAHFTEETGIKVNFTVLPENDVRDKISQDFANQAGQYDVATLSNYEIPIYARNGWLHEMNTYVAKDSAYDEQDVLTPMRQSLTGDDRKLYGQPFYGESSFLMYRKDVFGAKGLTMPPHPTWTQVADLAAKADGAEPGMKGICLRGLPGWGEVMAPLTTVVNTFGGTWFDKNWKARLDSPEWKRAVTFYVDLVRDHGESGAPQSGFAECLNNMTQSKVSMWYDATSAAGSLESANSPVRGKIGYVPAPVEKTESSGWLYTWAWGIQKASRNPDNAWKFVSWASSKQYEQLVGDKIGWSNVPAGKRASTYENPAYRQEAAAFQETTKEAIEGARPEDPGVQPRPAPGIQFVGIPEFTDLGTRVSQEISAAIAGRQSVESALRKSQKLAEEISEEYEGR